MRSRGPLLRALIGAFAFATTGVVAAPSARADAPASVPTDPAAAKDWREVVELVEKAMQAVNDGDRALAAFIASNALTPKGKASTSALTRRLDAARTQLQSTLDAAKLLGQRTQSSVADAARFRAANLASISDAQGTAQAADAATHDASFVDHTAEERAEATRKAAEALAARSAAADAARAAEEQKRKETDEQRKAQEQQRKSDEEGKRTAAAALALTAEAKIRGEAEAASARGVQSLKEQNDHAREVAAAISVFLARTNLTSDARNAGTRIQKELDAGAHARLVALGRISDMKDKPAAGAPTTVQAVTAEAQRLEKDLVRLTNEEKTLVSNPKSFLTGAVPPPPKPGAAVAVEAPRHLEDIVPVCEFTFEPADGKPMQVAIDGGPSHPLPTRARLASGRHTLSLRRDHATEERRELLLCGHIATVPIEPIK